MKKIEAGIVDWDILKEDLMELSKEELAELVNVWIKNYWTCQSYWMTYVNEILAKRSPANWTVKFLTSGTVQAYRIKRLLIWAMICRHWLLP